MLPGFAHAGYERIGASKQEDMRKECVPACEHFEVLHHKRIEQRCHQFLGADALLLQAVDVGFGEHAALARHRVHAQPLVVKPAKVGKRDAQLGAYLVDDGTRTAGALVVHRGESFDTPAFGLSPQDNDFGVLSPDFHKRRRLGASFFHQKRGREHLLYIFRPYHFSRDASPGSRHENAAVSGVETGIGFHPSEKLEQGFRLARLMPPVILPHNSFGVRICYDSLDGRGTDINADMKLDCSHKDLLKQYSPLNR